jgi:hypothetical protein
MSADERDPVKIILCGTKFYSDNLQKAISNINFETVLLPEISGKAFNPIPIECSVEMLDNKEKIPNEEKKS